MTVYLYAFSESRDSEGERRRLHQKLSQMAAWNPGWSYGEGETISARSVDVAPLMKCSLLTWRSTYFLISTAGVPS